MTQQQYCIANNITFASFSELINILSIQCHANSCALWRSIWAGLKMGYAIFEHVGFKTILLKLQLLMTQYNCMFKILQLFILELNDATPANTMDVVNVSSSVNALNIRNAA